MVEFIYHTMGGNDMKKAWLVLALCAIMITGCSSGVTQEEYDKVIEERDELKEKVDIAESKTEFEKTAAECKSKIESEYSHAEFIFYVGRAISEKRMDEVESSVESVYTEASEAIDNFYDITILADNSGVADKELFEEGTNNIQSAYNTWEETYKAVIEMENFIMNQ